MRGDWVEIVVDTGNGSRTFEVSASRAGRRVEVATTRQVVEVSEVTRTGRVVRTARFLANRVIALVEHPADELQSPPASAPRTDSPDTATQPAARPYEPDW